MGDPLTDAGSGAIKGGMLAGPAGAAAGGLLSLIGSGLNAWIAADEQERSRKQAEKQYKETLKIQMDQWKKQYDLQRQQFGLSKMQALEAMKQQRLQNRQYYDQQNEQRFARYSDRLINMVNGQDFKSRLSQIWGR